MTTDDHRAAGWTDDAMDRLRDALKAMPAEKDETANPSKEEPRG